MKANVQKQEQSICRKARRNWGGQENWPSREMEERGDEETRIDTWERDSSKRLSMALYFDQKTDWKKCDF